MKLLERVAKLRLGKDVLDRMFNGLVFTTPDGKFVYENGMLRGGDGLVALSPARVSSIEVPSSVKPSIEESSEPSSEGFKDSED